MTREYLLVDDQIARSRVFAEQVSIPGRLAFRVVDDPAMLRNSVAELEAFDGAIVDFHLNTSSSARYEPLYYDDPMLFSDPVEIRTGMGVMLFLRKHAPSLHCYGMTELTHGHAPLFLSAAWSWLGADPLNVDEPPETLREVLLAPDGERAQLQASYARMQAAIEPFAELMDSCLNRTPPEAYDWLRCYRSCSGPRPHTQLASELQRTIGVRVRMDPYKTYLPVMRSWQRALAAFVTAWGGDAGDWPEVDDKDALRTWKDRNPVLDYVRNGAYETFFNAADVRAALTFHRAAEPEQADDRW
jgi:hypothetical protein